MAASRSTALRLYKTMLKEALRFPAYNFRMYALRRVRDAFRQNATETDQNTINSLIHYGKENLEVMKRQNIIGNLYATEKLVIEKKHKSDPRERAFGQKFVQRNLK